MRRHDSAASLPEDSGEARLKALGYRQEFRRGFGLFTNAALAISIISVLTGITGSLPIAYDNGGPVSAVWGWVVVSVMVMFIGLSMAEIVSSLPSSGGPYFWAAQLATPRWAPLAGWVTGYFNLLGQVAVTASIEFTAANQIASMILLSTGYVLTQGQLLGVYTAILFAHAVLNSFPTRAQAWVSSFSVFWHVVGTFALIILIPAVAPTHQDASFVFTKFYGPDSDNYSNGASNSFYIFILGLLMSNFTITGYDSCAHMAEETKGADAAAPWAIVLAISSCSVIGFGYLLALLFSIQDPLAVNSPDSAAGGYVAGQIFYDAFLARFGTGTGGIVAMGIPLIGMFCCGASSLTSNSRMLWAFSRDRATPGWQLWSYVVKSTRTPIPAVWAMAAIAFLLGLPMLNSTVAFTAVVSISTIGLYISYGIPVLVRLINHRQFARGPFHLGRWTWLVGGVSVLWIAFITVVFCLPVTFPVDSQTLNYAPVAVGIVLVGSLATFFLPRFGAYRWFHGHHHTVEDYTVHQQEARRAEEQAALENGKLGGVPDDSAHGAANMGYTKM